MMETNSSKYLKHNVLVNLLDGGFFGFAMGFASFVTIIPLFVSSLTDSAILIGLIPAIHSVGWQFPQLFTAQKVSRQSRYKPMVMFLTIQERIPFLGMALVAWFSPILGVRTSLVLIFILLVWQGIGGGLTANPWQAMIGKIFPSEIRGTFLGAQSSAANLFASLSAVLAGLILQRMASPQDFTLAFLAAFFAMIVSWFFLSLTREQIHQPAVEKSRSQFWQGIRIILRKDKNFGWFLAVRMLSQLAVIGYAFYTVYVVNYLGMSVFTVGILTSVLLATQIVANPLMGWLGDRWSHRGAIQIGIIASIISALLAWWAPTAAWFFPVMILAGISNVSIWTISLAMIQEFGTLDQRPYYIGLANTLIAPVTILAPFIGGWIAERYSYPSAFFISACFGLVTAFVLQWLVQDPAKISALTVTNIN